MPDESIIDKLVQRMRDWLDRKKMPLLGEPMHKRHSEQEVFDEINIRLIPRYKTSGLSGDEWRFNAHVECKCRGKTFHDFRARNVREAVMRLPGEFLNFGCPLPTEWINHEREMCDNPACSNPMR